MNANRQEAEPESLRFADDGRIPNNRLSLLLYRQGFTAEMPDLASFIEHRFARNGWTGPWRGGVYGFHHYHSMTHEVLGVCHGTATLQLGGESGRKLDLHSGDVIVIPAGVGHKCVAKSEDFEVVGAYPEGHTWDLLRGEPGERPQADRHIAAVPLPETDPVHGPDGPLTRLWGPESVRP